jgi:hypothetical protein
VIDFAFWYLVLASGLELHCLSILCENTEDVSCSLIDDIDGFGARISSVDVNEPVAGY